MTAAGVALAGCASAEEPTASDAAKRGESEGTGGDSDADFDAEAVEAAIVDQINAVRFENNVPELGRDSDLRFAARQHSKDMHERDFFAHENPDGEQPWDRVPCDAAETLYESPIGGAVKNASGETFDTTTVRDAAAIVVSGWVKSDRHYGIMIDDVFERIGVGVVRADGRYLVTAMYC